MWSTLIVYLVLLWHFDSPDLHVFLPDLGVARDSLVLEVTRHDAVLCTVFSTLIG